MLSRIRDGPNNIIADRISVLRDGHYIGTETAEKLPADKLVHWMDLTGVINSTPWAARPAFVEGTDRPLPLVYHLNGGENAYKGLK